MRILMLGNSFTFANDMPSMLEGLMDAEVIQNTTGDVGLSDRISKDLKKRGFKYMGAVTIYSHLQACGIINDHDRECPCYQRIVSEFPTVNKRRDHEVE